jgi:hypothetical protein
VKAAALLLAGLALCACSTTRKAAPATVAAPAVAPVARAAPAPQPAVVVRKVPVSCVPKGVGPAPRYPDTDARLRAAAEAADRYQLLAAGRLLRIRRLAELERVVDACRTAE